MTIWSVWGEISGFMAVLCLITALAAIVAAAILLVHEKMISRLKDILKDGLNDRIGVLVLAAAIVWILVIGQSVLAAEAPSGKSTASGAGNTWVESTAENTGTGSSGGPSTEKAEETEPGIPADESGTSREPGTSAETGSTRSAYGATTAEAAEPVEPEAPEELPPDEIPPEVYIQMAENANRDEEGTIYCRADNAGIRVRFTDERENDRGITSYCIVVEDSRGDQIRRENSEPAGGGRTSAEDGTAGTGNTSAADDFGSPTTEASVGVTITAEETAALADGAIRVTARALDEAGNRGEASLTFVLDTTPPILTETDVSMPCANPAGIDEQRGIVYFGTDAEQYEGGEPVITASFRVIDQNIDPGCFEIRTAYAEVAAGKCCEQVDPGWKDAVKEDGEVAVLNQNVSEVSDRSGEDGEVSAQRENEGSPEEMQLTIRKYPGRDSTPDGVYRFGIIGADKAGNPLTLREADPKTAEPEIAEPEMAEQEKEETENGQREAGGENELTGVICESAEEGAFMTGRKVVDTKAPNGEICIANGENEVYCRMEAHDRLWTWEREGLMPYRSEENAVITYSAADTSPVSVSGRILSTDGENNEEAPDGGKFSPDCSGEIRIRGGQIFRIENWFLTDRAGNRSAVMRRSLNFYLDTAVPGTDIDAPHAVARAVSESTSQSPDGRGLYNGPVTLEIIAFDPDRTHGGSGLREVWYSVQEDGETVMEEILFRGEDMPEQAYDDQGEDLTDQVYEYRGEITIPGSGKWGSNDIKVTVYARDNAGNLSDPGDGGVFRFGIDMTGPEVTVRYDNNEVRNGKYFGGIRTAVITVRERNFARDLMKVTAPGAVTGEWERRKEETAAGGADVWTMEVRFFADGAYTMEVSGADAVGNAASVSYAGEAPQEFVIDRTPPLLEVFWDNTDVRNGFYYNRPRCATVRITDLSFDDRFVRTAPFLRAFRRVMEVRDDRTAGTIPVYEAELPFTEEGEWQLSCLCMDLAGNTAAPAYEEPFIIDMTYPRLYFDRDTVREMGAYGGEIAPELLCEDQNIDPGSLFAVWRNLTAGGGAMECRKGTFEGEKGSVLLPDLPQERTADGICMLWGTVCDLAGNRARVRRNLCVNRFGSLYDVSQDEGTMEMINDFYTEADKPFVITEYNVSPVVSRQVILYRNGNARVLTEGPDYSVAEERSGAGVKYVCTIDPGAYREEGKYSLLLESEDETGNISRSPGRFRSGTEYSPSWAVDRTAPSVRIIAPEAAENRAEAGRDKFVADSVTVRLLPADNMELGKLVAEIADEDGNIVERHVFEQEELLAVMERNGGEVPITIRASSKWQTLSATAVDGAGNSSDPAAYVVLVTSNLMVHLYRSGVLPAIAFLAFISAIRFGYGVYKHTLA